MSETERDTENEFLPDRDGRTPYLIQLGKVVYGNSPGEATDEFMSLVALEGLSSQNVRAWDLIDDIQYVVTPTGWIESAEIDQEEELTSEEYLAALDALAENAEALPGPNEAATNRFVGDPDEMSFFDQDPEPPRGIVDVELPEPTEETEPTEEAEAEPAICTRCKETHPLNEDGLCAQCVADLEGVA